MDKDKLCELLVMLQDLIIEAVKNPTFENVRFVIDASMFMRTLLPRNRNVILSED